MIYMEGLYYTKSHEWIRVEDETAYLGITDYAQDSLGTIVFVELPEVGDEFSAGDSFGAVESVKAASDLNTPVSGKIIEVNSELADDPEKINDEPYENWIIAFNLEDKSELDELMDEIEYKKFCEEEAD